MARARTLSRLERHRAVIKRAQFDPGGGWQDEPISGSLLDEAMNKLAEFSVVTDLSEERSRLKRILYTHITTVKETPKRVKIFKGHAKNIAKMAQDLSDAMLEAEKGCDGVKFWGELNKFNPIYQAADPKGKVERSFTVTIHYVDEIAEAAKAASERWQAKQPESINWLIDQLGEMWRRVTGEKPTRTGNFSDQPEGLAFQRFVTAAMDCLPKCEQYRLGKIRSIERVVKE